MSTLLDESGKPLRPRDPDRPILRLELSARGAIILILALLTLWLLLKLWPVLILVLISLMLAAALLPFVEWLCARGLKHGHAVVVVTLTVLAVFALLAFIVVPSVIAQGRTFANDLPELKADLAAELRARDQHDLAAEVERLDVSDIVEREQVVTTGRRVFGAVFAFLTVFVLTIYILIDVRRIERFFFFCVPDRYDQHVRNLIPALRITVGGYVRGQLVTSGAITIYTFVVLVALGVPNALGLAVVAGIADIIPLIGAFIAVIPSTIAALSVSTQTGVIVLILLLLYQQFEDRFLVPKVYGSTLRLPTVAVFLAVLIGASLQGIIGALLALPAAAALRVLIIHLVAIREGRIEPVEPEDNLFAPDEGSPAGEAQSAAAR